MKKILLDKKMSTGYHSCVATLHKIYHKNPSENVNFSTENTVNTIDLFCFH